MKRLYTKIIFLTVFFICSLASANVKKRYKEIDQLIDSYRLEEAKKQLQGISNKAKKTPLGLYTTGKIKFFEGRFIQSSNLLKQAIARKQGDIEWKYLKDQVDLSKKIFDSLYVSRGKSGIFNYYLSSKNDSLLIPYADRALIAQAKKLKGYFDDEISNINVLILDDIETMSDLCGLSVEQIKSSGTVAVTKFNRIMLLNPKTIEGGYPWLDTLAHELTHIIISRVSKNSAPIWLHEGIAKVSETWWRDERHAPLSPESAYLLDRAAKEGRLIPLRSFHPSISYLTNQEDSTLAYAQVQSLTKYIEKRISLKNGLKVLLKKMAEGSSLNKAIKELTTYEFVKIFRWWKEVTAGTRKTPSLLVEFLERRYKSGKTFNSNPLESLASKEVRRHLRIGDLLILNGYSKAASKEFKWALDNNDAIVPIISNRLIDSYIVIKKYNEAKLLLKKVKELYPYNSVPFIQSGRLNMAINNKAQALIDFTYALGLTPYSKEIHCSLALLYEDKKLKKGAKESCILLETEQK